MVSSLIIIFTSLLGLCWSSCSPRVDLINGGNYTILYNVSSSLGQNELGKEKIIRALKGTKNAVRAYAGDTLVITVNTYPKGDDINAEKICLWTKFIHVINVQYQGAVPPIIKTSKGLHAVGPPLSWAQVPVADPSKWSRSCLHEVVFSRIDLSLTPVTYAVRAMAKALFIHGCPQEREVMRDETLGGNDN